MFANSWITLSGLQSVANVLAIFTFVSGTLGIAIGMCGPMNHPVTTYCRMHYLQLVNRRTLEIWQHYILPILVLYAAVIAYRHHWFVTGLFLSLICLLWVLRTALLNRFPERGYVHRTHELKFDLDWLKASE